MGDIQVFLSESLHNSVKLLLILVVSLGVTVGLGTGYKGIQAQVTLVGKISLNLKNNSEKEFRRIEKEIRKSSTFNTKFNQKQGHFTLCSRLWTQVLVAHTFSKIPRYIGKFPQETGEFPREFPVLQVNSPKINGKLTQIHWEFPKEFPVSLGISPGIWEIPLSNM